MLNLNTHRDNHGMSLLISKFEMSLVGEKITLSVNEYTDLINYYIIQKQIPQAFVVLQIALEKYPAKFDLLIAEAQLLIESGMFAQASRKLKKLFIKRPDDLSLLMLIGLNYAHAGLSNKAMMFFDKAINLVTKDRDEFIYNIAQTFISDGRYDLAAFYLTMAYQLNPNNCKILPELAFCYEKSRKFSKSEKLYKIYLKYKPFSKIAWYNLGVVLTNLNKNDEALQAFDFALALNPDFSSALLNKANILSKKSDFTKAIKILTKVIELEPNNYLPYYLRGQNYLKSKQYKSALRDLLKSLRINKQNHEAWYLVAAILYKSSLKRSKKALYNALKISRLNSKYWLLSAKIFNIEKKQKFVDKSFLHAISFDPFVDKYWFLYADYKIQENDIKEAISILKSSHEFVQNKLFLYLKISSLHFLEKNETKAIIYYKKAIKISPQAKHKLIDIHPHKHQLNHILAVIDNHYNN